MHNKGPQQYPNISHRRTYRHITYSCFHTINYYVLVINSQKSSFLEVHFIKHFIIADKIKACTLTVRNPLQSRVVTIFGFL